MKGRHLAGLAVVLPVAVGLGALLVSHASVVTPTDGVAGYFLENSAADSGSINVVSTVLLDYRAFDTLGEASVIFASVAAVGALFAGSKLRRHSVGLGIMVRRAVSYLSPLFWLFPVYIVLHGHLSPGGGFQGGVSLAVLVILLSVVFGTDRGTATIGPSRLHAAEAVSALAFLFAGLFGVIQGVGFLANVAAGLPAGRPGALASGGLIPILNLVIGCKVAAGLGSIFLDILSTEAAG